MQMYFDRVRPNVARIIGQQTLLSKHMRERRDSVPSDNGSNIASPRSAKLYTTSDEVNEIWCVLVFRMLCWLQLHDFHKMDIHITKSDAYASRIPVYIV